MDHCGSKSGKREEPSSARAADVDLGRALAELPELLGEAMPHVQAALRRLLAIADATGDHVTQQQHQHIQELADEVPTSFGGDGFLHNVRNAGQTLQQTVLLGNLIDLPVSRGAAAEHLLEPPPARAALLQLLAALVRWEPGWQLPAASGGERREGQQPGNLRSNAAVPSSAEQRVLQGNAPAAAGGQLPAASSRQQQQQQPSEDVVADCAMAEREGHRGKVEPEQAHGADGRLVGEDEGLLLAHLRNGTCMLVAKLLGSALQSSAPTYDVHRALLSLEFGCSLLRTHVLPCLSRQLAAVSEGLVGQLPPEVTVSSQPAEHGAKQGQQQRENEAAPAPPFTGLRSAQMHHATATTSGVTHMARRTLDSASVLLLGLHGLVDTATDTLKCARAAGDTGPLYSSRALQQQQQAEDARKELRQLSRRYLLLLAGGLRDSHVLDHWARAVLLAGLCRGAGKQGREEEEGNGEVLPAAAGGGLPSMWSKLGQQQQQQPPTQWPGEQGAWLHLPIPTAPDVPHVWSCLGAVRRLLVHCQNARAARSGDPLGSLPPALDTALYHALSGPCTQHLILALGTLMLHQADGGSLYGMPLPYRTGPLAAAVERAGWRLCAFQDTAQEEGLLCIDSDLYLSLLFQLSHNTNEVPKPLPVVPTEGHLDLLLRLGQLAVRSARAYRAQDGATGRRGGLVMGKQYTGVVAMTALWEARTRLILRSKEALAGAGGGAGTVEGPSGGLGGAAGAAGRDEREEGSGADRAVAVADGQADAGQLGTVAASSVGHPGRSTAAAARRAARAAVAAETRWHRLLLDTGLWAEMEGEQLEDWMQDWNKVGRQQGGVPKDKAYMTAAAPAPVAGALAAGVLPCLERVLRRAGERAASGASAAGDPPLLSALFSIHLDWWTWLGWLLSYGDVRQGASFMVTLRKLLWSQELTTVARQLEAALCSGPCTTTPRLSPTAAAYTKAKQVLLSAVEIGLGLDSGGGGGRGGYSGCAGAGQGSPPGASSGGNGSGGGDDGVAGGCGSGGSSDGDGENRNGGGGDSGGGGDGVGGIAGKDGNGSGSSSGGYARGTAVVGCASGGSSSAQLCGQGGSGMDSPGLPRGQLLLWYGVRQLMPALLDMAAVWGPCSPLLRDRGVLSGIGLQMWASLLPVVVTLSLQVAGEGPSQLQGSDGGGSGSSVPPVWLSSWRRVLLEEWRVVELVGSALEVLVPVLGTSFHAAGACVPMWSSCAEGLAAAVCAVTLAFPEQVWSAAEGPGPEVRNSVKGGNGSSSSSRRQGRHGASSASARSVWALPTTRVHELRDLLVRAGRGRPEVGALVALAQMESAGGPSAPLAVKGTWAVRTLELREQSELFGGYRWWVGEVPSPELLDGLLRTCSYPRCASLEGDSEAGAEGRLAACGRGCGGAWYCCQACEEAHWQEGHAEGCGGGAAARGAGQGGMLGSGAPEKAR